MNNKQKNTFLVIPTIRDLHFLKSWKDEFKNCHLIVIEDWEKQTVNIPSKSFKSITRFTWEDIDRDLGENKWIISRHNAGIRSYGFWKATQLGADVIITIDDDCYPTSDPYVSGHLENLSFSQPVRWTPSYPDPKWMYTRGFPYAGRESIPTYVSHGLWSGALDLDAKVETKLKSLLKEKKYPLIRQFIPNGNYYPMCSMNLAFKKEVAVLMFFPMMGMKPDGSHWPYDRFDDIWAGIFSKKIMDHLKMGVINGSPFVDHRKASMPKINYIKEASGMDVNDTLWKKIDAVKLTAKTPKACYIELATKVKFPNTSYFKQLKKAMVVWANLF